MNSQSRMKTRRAGHLPFAQMAEIQESLDEAKSTIWKYYIRKEA
jgi:hypothetical protein